jgi:hypothetical protein
MEHELLLYPELYADGYREYNCSKLVQNYLYEWDIELADEDAEHPIWDLAVEVVNDYLKGEPEEGGD